MTPKNYFDINQHIKEHKLDNKFDIKFKNKKNKIDLVNQSKN
jgi:hypothetical protein